MTRDATKLEYIKPVLRAHGKVESLTKGSGTGGPSDAIFSTTSPDGNILLS